MTRKKLFVILISFITAVCAAALFLVPFYLRAGGEARVSLASEYGEIKKDTEELEAEEDEIKKQIEDIDTQLSTKDTVNNYYMEYKDAHDALVNEIADMKKESARLDEEINKERAELEKSAGVSDERTGKTYTLEKSKTYSCPDDIPSGRYAASGKGNIVITSSVGKIRASYNLDVAYNNEYTFNLSDKEKIKTSSEVTLTELVK